MPSAQTQTGSKAEIRGSSKSLKKTIRELEALLRGADLPPSVELRQSLHDKLRLLVEAKYQEGCEYGFKRAHAICRRHSNAVPKKIECQVGATILGSPRVFAENEISISLVSEVK